MRKIKKGKKIQVNNPIASKIKAVPKAAIPVKIVANRTKSPTNLIKIFITKLVKKDGWAEVSSFESLRQGENKVLNKISIEKKLNINKSILPAIRLK